MNESVRVYQFLQDEGNASTDILIDTTNKARTTELMEMASTRFTNMGGDQSFDVRGSMMDRRQSIMQSQALRPGDPDDQDSLFLSAQTQDGQTTAAKKPAKKPMDQALYNPVKEHQCFERFDFYNYDVQSRFPDVNTLNWPWYYQYHATDKLGVQMDIYDDITCMTIELQY